MSMKSKTGTGNRKGVQGLRSLRKGARDLERYACREAEKALRPMVRELFRALPLQSLSANIALAGGSDKPFDVSGVCFFAEPLHRDDFRKSFLKASPLWREEASRQGIPYHPTDVSGSEGGTLFRCFATKNGTGGEGEFGTIMAELFHRFERKYGKKELASGLDELDWYAFTAERSNGRGIVKFRIHGFNPNALGLGWILPEREW